MEIVKITSKTTTFGWVWLGVSFVQSDCRIISSSISKESIDVLDILHGDGHQEKVVFETITLVRCGQVCLLSNLIEGFFNHQYLWMESIDIKIV